MLTQLKKSRTGIEGLDELTGGGLPQGRPTLVCGPAGCGKTLLGMEFLVHGALQFGEAGVFMAFEESVADLTENVASLGFDLDALVAQHLLALDFVRVERSELSQSGDFDLEGLFIRLGLAIDRVGAKRVVLDTIEALFSGLPNPAILRAELRRLFRWLKDKGVTAILTGERGEQGGELTRQGLEEYVSDCVIVLDNRVNNMISARRMRVVKYRGSTHGSNEYPFLINESGISVLPVTLGLRHEASRKRVSSGVPGLDEMLGGTGFYCGSSVLVSGTAGSGKSSLASQFADAACRRGERVLYFAFEESAAEIARNMASIGLDLTPWVTGGSLKILASRPTLTGLETHFSTMLREIASFAPQAVVVDPLNSLVSAGNEGEVKLMLLHMIDALKLRRISGLFTYLTAGGSALERADIDISSLFDSCLILRDIESGGERHRGLCVLKSRGMAHSNQVREFALTAHGIEVRQGHAGALTGAARRAQEAGDPAPRRDHEIARAQAELVRRRAVMEANIAAIRAQFAAYELGGVPGSGLAGAGAQAPSQEAAAMPGGGEGRRDERDIRH